MGTLFSSARAGLLGVTATAWQRFQARQVTARAQPVSSQNLRHACGSQTPRLGVLVDAENVQLAHKDWLWLQAKLAHYGTVPVRRAYARWGSKPSSHETVLHQAGFRLMHHGSGTTGKNAADIAMAVDAMQVSRSGLVDGFCLVSKDADFTPLVVALRESGMLVLGCGGQQAARTLREACDEYFTLPVSYTASGAARTMPPTASQRDHSLSGAATPVTPREARSPQSAKTLCSNVSDSSSASQHGAAVPAQNNSPDAASPKPKLAGLRNVNYSTASDAELVAFFQEAIIYAGGKPAAGRQHWVEVNLCLLGNFLSKRGAKVGAFSRSSHNASGLSKLLKTLPHHFVIEKRPAGKGSANFVRYRKSDNDPKLPTYRAVVDLNGPRIDA